MHAKDSFIFMQLWANGRAAKPYVLRKTGPYDVVGPSAIPIAINERYTVPRPLTVKEIKEGQVYFVGATAEVVLEGEGLGEDEELVTFTAFCELDDHKNGA